MRRFFLYEPTYKERFSEVWLWDNWAHRNNMHDIGIDLVARERATDRYVGIQCKCYENEHILSEKDVQTFFAALHMRWDTDNDPEDTFSSGIVIATCYYTSKNFDKVIDQQATPCSFLGMADLERYEEIDWARLEKGRAHDIPKKELRPHQDEAIHSVLEAFRNGTERGKMIMACGTGKTFTSLRLTEKYTGGKGCVLFLAPSIALVSQSLQEWMCQTKVKLHPIAVCSDSKVAGANENSDLAAVDLPSPATTDPVQIAANYTRFKDTHLTVIFSTYQSLDKVQKAQRTGALPEFDLTICDEAHRTAGVSWLDQTGKKQEIDFRLVHNQSKLKSKRRLYMTATPKVYGDAVHEKAKLTEGVTLADMRDVTLFGEELYRLPFSRAVREGLLTDYKVLVLCVDEDYVEQLFKDMDLPDDVMKRIREESDEGSGKRKKKELSEKEIAIKLVGCFNGLRKAIHLPHEQHMAEMLGISENEYDKRRVELLDWQEDHAYDFMHSDPEPMHRAVAFAGKIKDSKTYATLWEYVGKAIRESENGSGTPFPTSMHHVDGTMNMSERERELRWLKEPTAGECRILTNAQCLSEGVDVPALDAIMFLAPKKSQIDIVQSVGRVMRRDPSGRKKFGYVIIPVGVPSKAKAEDVLDDDERFKVVWQVLQALRAHDDRFDAEINALEFNKRNSRHISVAGVTRPSDGSGESNGDSEPKPGEDTLPLNLALFVKTVKDVREAVFARMVMRVGARIYWENWAKDIADIAERRRQAIEQLVQQPDCALQFQAFRDGLRENIRPDISEKDAVEMLAMQFVSRPVFNALFGEYEFADKNPVSVTMNCMLNFIEQRIGSEDDKTMKRFYEDVKTRAGSIITTEGRQSVIKELYENFFKNAFRKIADTLGIVYTPVEVVDFILHSVHKVLQKELGIADGLSAEGVRILDPFTGTGTFIVRAIQSGLIKKEDLPRKYEKELFASEIVLLAYYIACVNIEVAYHGDAEQKQYTPFDGICFTDTFRMHENSANDRDLFPEFEENGERVKRLCKQDIRVIIGNPPYSVGQKSANDNNQNVSYPKLDARIEETYAARSTAGLKKGLYDSYIRAFRWASDCIKGDGVLAYVTNGSYIDNNAMAGFRECLMDEFSSIYCFNLRGNQRTSGELSRKEGGKIFGSGSRTPVAIIVLVKRADHAAGQRATLYYHDIGDYKSRDEKLQILKDTVDIDGIEWTTLVPDQHGDWINPRTEGFEQFMPIGDKSAKGKGTARALFEIFSLGVSTNRDAWCYNFSEKVLNANISNFVSQYNEDVERHEKTYDGTKIKWSSKFDSYFDKAKRISCSKNKTRVVQYRPFCKQQLYFDNHLNDRPGQFPNFFPTPQHENLVIQMTGAGSTKPFSCLINDTICDLEQISKGQCFPLYWYEKRADREGMLELGLEEAKSDYIRRDGITDWGHKEFKQAYGDPKIGKEDLFYYVYGLLHSEEYRTKYANDLKKELPRIPKVKDFWGFSEAGRKLAELHLNYETVDPYPLEEEHNGGDYRIEDKMRFPKKGVRDTIIYNSTTILRGIPEEAYEYIVNGKSAIEWLMERYAVTTDKDSGIVNDPNDWCKEHNNPRYIFDLIKRIVTVSVETVKITRSLPKLEEL